MDWLRKIPIGQYVYGDFGWLRKLDPRLKMSWVLIFLLTPILAVTEWRFFLVIILLGITFLSGIPIRIWWRSFILVLILAAIVGFISMLLPTSELAPTLYVRDPNELSQVINKGQSWDLFSTGIISLGRFNIGDISIDRRSAELAINSSTLIFSVVHSVNLMLITTSPEDLMWAIRWFISPLAFLGVPVNRFGFQLLLALRFLPLVQEEFQNLLRSISTRNIKFKQLGLKGSFRIFLAVGERFLANILLRADQGADALVARGVIIPSPNQLRLNTKITKSSKFLNVCSFLGLIVVLSVRSKYGNL
tara:strand:- start:3922 stop:4836 length:915 start_codon:yes stop_codon:yes gene_type:complete